MRHVQLPELINQVKAQVGIDLGVGDTMNEAITLLLSTKQQWLASAYRWLFLQREWDIAAVAGTRYYALPTVDVVGEETEIDTDSPMLVRGRWTEVWLPLEQGIGAGEYTAYDPELDERQSPVRRFQLREYDQGGQYGVRMEVWPLPDEEQTLRVFGQRKLRDLTIYGCDLDSLLLVLMVAYEYALRIGLKQAPALQSMAQQRLMKVLGNETRYEERVVLGGREVLEPRGPATRYLLPVKIG